MTSTTILRSPRPRCLSRGIPSPLSVSVAPGCVPPSSLTVLGPSRVGTSTSAPSVASTKLTLMWWMRSSPSRNNTGSSLTFTLTYKSPGGAPGSPACPPPETRSLMPLSIPSGTRRWWLLISLTLPLPRQLSHTTSMTRPRPPHVEHRPVVTIWPRMLSRTVLTDPTPLQVGQVCDSVPPTPSQTSQLLTTWTLTSRAAPNAASRNDTSTSTSASLPRAGPWGAEVPKNEPPPKRSPKKASKMSSKPPKGSPPPG